MNSHHIAINIFSYFVERNALPTVIIVLDVLVCIHVYSVYGCGACHVASLALSHSFHLFIHALTHSRSKYTFLYGFEHTDGNDDAKKRNNSWRDAKNGFEEINAYELTAHWMQGNLNFVCMCVYSLLYFHHRSVIGQLCSF